MIRNLLNHIESRRRWNKFRRQLRDRAYSRALTTVFCQWPLRGRI